MFYTYFRIFNFISTIFGLRKPFNITDINKKNKIRLCRTLWSVSIVIAGTVCYFFSVNFSDYLDLKQNLPDIDGTNNLFVNVMIIVLELINEDEVFIQIYTIIRKLIQELNLSYYNVKLFSVKLHLWIISITVVFFVLIVAEFLCGYPPYVLIFKIPVYLTMAHIIIHLCVLLAFLKAVNLKLSQSLSVNNSGCTLNQNISFMESLTRKRKFAYLLNAKISFIESSTEYVDLKSLCHFYDDITSCIRLLEMNHGPQVFLTVWLMFSSAVIGVTIVVVTEKTVPWLVISKSAELFLWYYLGCYVNEQIGREAEQTELLIMKYLINIRCDQPRRNLLTTFKQLVSTNRTQFIACNLFCLNYGTILGTVVSVITYSIILNQLFWSS